MGDLSLDDISHHIELTKPEIRNALLVAVHHRVVTFYDEAVRENIHVTKYAAQIDTIITRIRYPVFLYHIKRNYGDLCELIIEMIMLEGTVLSPTLLTYFIDNGLSTKAEFVNAFKVLRDSSYIKTSNEKSNTSGNISISSTANVSDNYPS